MFLGRFVPLVRSLVSLPAGAALLPRGRFLVLTALGSAVWNAAWVYGGFVLGARWEQAGQWSSWLNIGLLAATGVLVGRYVWTRRHRFGPFGSA